MSSRRVEVTNSRRRTDEFETADALTGDEVLASPTRGRVRIGAFILDPETGRLYEGDRVLPLAPKPFETLLYLASRAGRVVSKAELMERLWPDTFVTDDVLVQCVVDIRRALGDTAKSPHFIQTIPRRGYQLMVEPEALPRTNGHPLLSEAPTAPLPGEPLPPAAPPARAQVPLHGRVLWGAAALLLAAVAALVIYVTRVRAPTALEAVEPGSLLVMPVSVEEADHQSGWLREGLAEMIRSQLGQTPGLHVVARHRLASALADAGYVEDKLPASADAARIARALRSQKMVTGSFVRVDDRFVLSAAVVDVASGRSEGTASVRGRHPTDLLDAVDELCLKLVQHLEAGGPRGEASAWRPTRLATRSLDASRHYVEALTFFAGGGRKGAEQAEESLDRAIALDPTFAQAYLKKAEVQEWRRRWGHGKPDPVPAVRAAARLGKDLPDRDRLLVESFEALIVRAEPQEALRHWSSLLQFYPTYAQEIGIPSLVADTFLHLGRWDDLIMVAESHVDSPSLPGPERALLSQHLATAFRRKGEFVQAQRHARRAVALWPTQKGPRFLANRVLLGRIALEAGDRQGALLEFAAVGQAPEADVTSITDAAWGYYMADQRVDAERLVEQALRLDPDYGNAWHLRGWMQMAEGQWAQAAESLATAFERTPQEFGNPHQGLVGGDLAALYYSGVASAKAGQADRARQAWTRVVEQSRRALPASGGELNAKQWQAASFLARAGARLQTPVPDPPRLQGDDTTYYVQSARLHAVQGRTAIALQELARGISLGHGELRHIEDDPDFEPLHGDPQFESLLAPPVR
jgi:DNA-binding winged helix-turn-helix (wHTH) protein/tetratricopeptide (TPR) repeat protein/TolB-like protein